MPAKKSIPHGTRFTRLTVLGIAAPNEAKKSRSQCRCDCGTELSVLNYSLSCGDTGSCGCLQREITVKRNFKHGHNTRLETSRIYAEWSGIIQRCTNPNSDKFKWYGQRGITVCDRWRNSFDAFLEDVGHGQPGWTIHRINNDVGYFLENVVWATQTFQTRHMSRNRVINVNGITACLSELCEKLNVPYARTKWRLNAGWDVEKAFHHPPLNCS